MKKRTKHSLPTTALILFAAFSCCTKAATAGEPLRLSLWPGDALLGDGKSERVEVPITYASSGHSVGRVPSPGVGHGDFDWVLRNLQRQAKTLTMTFVPIQSLHALVFRSHSGHWSFGVTNERFLSVRRLA